jgi:hypothetical protein
MYYIVLHYIVHIHIHITYTYIYFIVKILISGYRFDRNAYVLHSFDTKMRRATFWSLFSQNDPVALTSTTPPTRATSVTLTSPTTSPPLSPRRPRSTVEKYNFFSYYEKSEAIACARRCRSSQLTRWLTQKE